MPGSARGSAHAARLPLLEARQPCPSWSVEAFATPTLCRTPCPSLWPVVREAPLTQIAKDFCVFLTCLHRWLQRPRSKTAFVTGLTLAEEAQVREPGGATAARAGERGPAPRRHLPRPGRPPKMMYPLVRELADDGIPVTVTCRVLGFSTQADYKWKAAPDRPGRVRCAPRRRRPRRPRR